MTTQQRLFNLYIERNYPRLVSEHPKKDMLHSAYLSVWDLRRPIMPTAENFERLISRAYHYHILAELYYSMRFFPPEPKFWEECNLSDEEQDETPSIADITERENERLKQFLRERFKNDDVILFNLAIAQHSVEDISEITGRKRADIRKTLGLIRNAIETEYIEKRTQA